MDQFDAQELANTAWGFATAGPMDEQLFEALASMAMHRLDEFNAQDLTDTAWALAVAALCQKDEQLFKALAGVADWRLE